MSNRKKHDMPAMPFYFGDWRKCPEVQALDLETRMLWFEMLGWMWESTERGYLTINGSPVPLEALARMLGVSRERLSLGLTLMGTLQVYGCREKDGALYCRRMVRDEGIRQKRAAGGILGGNPVLKVNHDGSDKGYPFSEDEDEERSSLKKGECEGEKKKVQVAPTVQLTTTEIEKFVSTLGQNIYDRCVAKLSDYKQANGKKYKSDAAAIRMWVIRAVNEEMLKGPKARSADAEDDEEWQ